MKTNVLMKIAVVFMAAFGAYAFSGNTESQMFTRSDTCENITAACSTMGDEECQILVDSNIIPVLDFNCVKPIKHLNSSPVSWY